MVGAEVLYHGRNINTRKENLFELRKSIGIVFQQPTLFPMSIRDNILYGPRRMRRLGRAEVADKVSNMVSLAAKAFSQADAALAQRVFAMDDGVDELYDRCEQVVVDLIRSETQGASHLPELLMVAKYFERMGDDAERIASWAVFRATGEHALHSAGKENAEG